MPDVRKEMTYDGCCTVFIGSQVVITDLTGPDADAFVSSYKKIVLDEPVSSAVAS